jgi:hypothetical protein
MPYTIRKLPNQNLYKVYNTETKTIHSYATTLENANKQVKLLHMVDAGVPLKKQGGSCWEGYEAIGMKKKNDKLVPNCVPMKGGAITTIDKTSTGVMRVKLNDNAKRYLDEKLLPLISNTTIRITDSRKNSGVGRTQVFGYGNIRTKGFGEFKNNTDYPELYRALLIFGMKVVPDYIPFTAIQVNHNYKTKKHIDANNIGLSLAVSFGNFTGGELVIGNKEYQTKLHPVIFNGALSEHFNKPIKGDRYSLVFFVSAPKKYTDEQVYALHNKVINNIRLKKGEGLIGGSIETDNFTDKGIVSLPEFRSVKIDLPTYMYKRMPDIKGKPPPYRYRLVIPITKARNISSRKQQTSIDISQKPISIPEVNIEENFNEKPKIEEFSPSDRVKIQEYYLKVMENEDKEPNEIEKDPYEIKQRGKPLPCPGSKKSKKEEPIKVIEEDLKMEIVPVKKKKEKPVLERKKTKELPKEDIPDINELMKQIEEEETKKETKKEIPKELDEEEQDELFLMLNDYDAYMKKYGSGIKNKISVNNKKMSNPWITYVKEYASKNGMSYRDALKDPKCKAGYKKPMKGAGVIDEVGKDELIALMNNDSELGANAGKKYISL